MLRKQVFISSQLAKEIEVRAQEEGRSESSILRSVITQAFAPGDMNVDIPSTLPFAINHLLENGEQQVALMKFILKSLLFTRNYSGRALLELLQPDSAEIELEELKQATEDTYQQILKELK